MKLAVSWFCILNLAFINAGLFTRNDLQAAHKTSARSRAQAPQTTEYLSQGRHRPLFARRGQYERQRIQVPTPKEVPVPPHDPARPSKVAPEAVKPKCSQLTQSCLPQSGCCDPCATCHCRFFNAICFCRTTTSSHKKKT